MQTQMHRMADGAAAWVSRARTVVTCSVVMACVLLAGCNAAPEEIQPPIPIPDPTPIAYPEGLWDRGVQGETEVLIHIDEMGDVDSVLVSKSSGFSDFDSAAVNGVRRLRFTPGQRGDRRIAMWTRMPVRFARDSTATIGTSTGSGVVNQ
ncbi:MAG: energy transducer TonB [Gemmatimonadetes bacterium]|nr:energy transducer TonB [Gemmatimonadota bacterium]